MKCPLFAHGAALSLRGTGSNKKLGGQPDIADVPDPGAINHTTPFTSNSAGTLQCQRAIEQQIDAGIRRRARRDDQWPLQSRGDLAATIMVERIGGGSGAPCTG